MNYGHLQRWRVQAGRKKNPYENSLLPEFSGWPAIGIHLENRSVISAPA